MAATRHQEKVPKTHIVLLAGTAIVADGVASRDGPEDPETARADCSLSLLSYGSRELHGPLDANMQFLAPNYCAY